VQTVKWRNPALVALLTFASLPSWADVASLAQSWDEITYQRDPATREQALNVLAERARAELTAAHDNPALLIWYGIIVSSYAGEKGGLGALGLCKEARASLERAIDRDPTALDGSAFTSLGTLYYKVPGWPIGFGSEKKAREYLSKALDLNPTGIDPNYFMGDFLFTRGEYGHARSYLTTALNAPDRPDRPIGDAGRRREIRTLLAKVDQKLGDGSAH
jgi:tetratricopeptide (TPR) repeat protein